LQGRPIERALELQQRMGVRDKKRDHMRGVHTKFLAKERELK